MKVIIGIVLLLIGVFFSIKTIKSLIKHEIGNMVQANNIKILFGEITLIGLGLYLIIKGVY